MVKVYSTKEKYMHRNTPTEWAYFFENVNLKAISSLLE